MYLYHYVFAEGGCVHRQVEHDPCPGKSATPDPVSVCLLITLLPHRIKHRIDLDLLPDSKHVPFN